jgi:hypothetical protein
VQIVFLIGEAVVVPVMGGPPKNAFLRRRHGHPGDDELKPAAGLKGTMRKIAVVAGGDEKHANFIKQNAGEQIGPAKVHEENAQSRQVDGHKWKRGNQLKTSPVWQRYRERACDRCHAALLLREK